MLTNCLKGGCGFGLNSVLARQMRERELQCVGKKVLLLGVCLLSLWGQLSLASSHRSHIVNEARMFAWNLENRNLENR
ncbi:protein FAM19A2-like, partial [Clarias magur]